MSFFRVLSNLCLLVAAVLLAAFFGACRTLVAGESGGYHERAALVGAVIAGVFCIVFRVRAARGGRLA